MLLRSFFSFVVLTILVAGNTGLQAQSKDEIINGSYFVAFGRFANSSELNYWRSNVGSRNIPQMVSNHKDYLKSDLNERQQTVTRSYMDAFGWSPSKDELNYWVPQNKTYAELMSNHINNWLNLYKDKKEHVIRQSYYKVFNRNATADEVKYWMGQPTLPFVQLVAIHTTWKQKNQAASKMGAPAPNIRSNGISTFGLSSAAVAQVVAAGGANVVSAGGANVVSAGGANVVSAGGLN